MNGGQVLVALCCLGFFLVLLLGFEVAIFRIACALCRVPPAGLLRTTGVVMVMLVVPAILDGIFSGVLWEVYREARYPLWEAGLVQFFLALPVHMIVCSAIHAKMVQIQVGQGIAVWLVEKLLKLGLLAAIAAVVALGMLAGQGK